MVGATTPATPQQNMQKYDTITDRKVINVFGLLAKKKKENKTPEW